MQDLIHRIQRELPDTDNDRYDIAYQRGRAQARSGLLLGGLALGSAIGAGLMFLLDPERGKTRRSELAQRANGLKNDIASTASGRAEDLQNRATGFAIEHDLKDAAGSDASPAQGHDHPSAVLDEYGAGYKEGFGRTEHDPEAPGAQVADPITDRETAEHGSSGPIAGAGHGRSEEEPAVAR